MTFDTTTVPDGTHFLSFRVIDCSDATWRAYPLVSIGSYIIVQNHGAVNGAQLVPVASAGINFRSWILQGAPAVTCDFLNYPGTPPLGTPRPYPAPVVPPAFSPSSPYHSNPAALRMIGNWFTESSITEPVIGEYNDVQHLCTTKTGGVAAFGFYPHTGLNFEGAYDSEYRQDMHDGPRQQCSVSPYVTWVPHPDNVGDASDLWVGVEINGRILTMGLDGTVTTIAGNKLNYPAVLPYSFWDSNLTEADFLTRKTVIGNIVAPTFGDFTGLNDLCFDPRPDANGKHTLLYACKPNDNLIFAVDLSFNPPRCYRYAGQDGAPDGYVEGDPLAAAQFAGPYSIIMADGRNPALPAGTMLVADKRNSAIRKIAPGATRGIAGTVSTLCGGTVGPTPPTEAQLQTSPLTYSPQSTVTGFANAYTAFPQVIRFFSDGNVMLGEDHTTFIREINLSGSGSIRFIAAFYGSSWGYNGSTWFWADIDSVGAIGPVDDIIYTEADGVAAAEASYRCSRDGTYNDVFVSDLALPESGGAGHYPWAQAVSKTQARYLSSGFAQNGVFSIRAANPATDPVGIGHFDGHYNHGQDIYRYGTCLDFPFGIRPPLSALHGIYGQAFVDTKTFSDLMALYPSTTPGDAGDQALAAYIQSGMDGSVPRPEITGNDMADLIYFIRRTSLEGHGPPAVLPKPTTSPVAPPTVSNVAATRSADGKSLTVTWTTNVPTIGLAGAGPAGQQAASGYDGKLYAYTVWSPLESGFGTSHSVTITGLLPGWTPIHYAVLSKDVVGDFVRSNDAVLK